jgi:hypothetical protein
MTDPAPIATPAPSKPLDAALLAGWQVHPTPGWYWKGTDVLSEADLIARFSMVVATNATGKPHPLVAPIDMSRAKKEADVKDKIKALLNFHGWFTWMPGANGYGQQGVSDHAAIKNGVFLVVEAKFGSNKPKPLQKAYAAQIIANDGYAFCVNEKNIDHLAMWLESFEFSIQWQMAGNDPEELPQEHGARLLNAIAVLTDMWGDTPSNLA